MPTDRRYGTYLFDLDGTLIDSIDLIMASFRHALRTHLGGDPSAEQDARWRAGFGTPLRTQLAKFAETPDKVDALVGTYRTYTLAHHDRLIASYAGIDAAVAQLERDGVRLAVVTSKTSALARRGLERCGLNRHFDVLIGMDDVSEHKPHPAPVFAALDRLAADPSDAVFIGDSPHDIIAGHAAGVHTAAVLWGPFARTVLAQESPRHWLSDPTEIATIAP